MKTKKEIRARIKDTKCQDPPTTRLELLSMGEILALEWVLEEEEDENNLRG